MSGTEIAFFNGICTTLIRVLPILYISTRLYLLHILGRLLGHPIGLLCWLDGNEKLKGKRKLLGRQIWTHQSVTGKVYGGEKKFHSSQGC